MLIQKPRLLGVEIDRSTTTDRLAPQRWLTQMAAPAIPIMRWARNGKHPNAALANAMGQSLNQAAMLRTKEVFRAIGTLSGGALTLAPTPGSRNRWRWAFHTGPLTRHIAVVCVMQPTQSTTLGDTYCTVQLDKLSGGGTVSDEFHAGPNPTGNTDPNAWSYLKTSTTWLAVDPDTDYVGVFVDGPNARIQSACAWEIASMQTGYGGYLPQNLTERAPILSTDRQRMMELARLLWKRGGAHVFNWYCDDSSFGPRTISSATPTNVIDLSTVISSSSAGYTLDMRYKDRVSQTSGVPCKLWAYAAMTGAGASGTVYLKSSAGTTIASVAGFTTTAGWQSTTFTLPATLDKYDVMAAMGAANIKVHAVSVGEFET